MRLKRLNLKNIRSFDSETIRFPEGSTLLSGDIGSGKTTILLAIEFAFFGLQPGQRGTALLANGKDQGSVVLEFDLDDKTIIIERWLKRGSKTVSQDQASITMDGETTETSVTELKTKVLELLQYPAEFVKKTNLLYRYTVYTPQEEMKSIVLEDPETRLNILRHIFGIDKYKRIRDNLLLFTSKLREESRVLQVEVRTLEENKAKLTTQKTRVQTLESHIAEKKTVLQQKVDERKTLEDAIADLEDKIKQKQEFETEAEKTQIKLANKREQNDAESKNLLEIEQQIKKTEGLFDEKLYHETIKANEKYQQEIEELNKRVIELSGSINSLNIRSQEEIKKKERLFTIDICPTCLQDVPESHKHNILNETESNISRAQAEIKSMSDDLDSVQGLLKEKKRLMFQQEDRKNELELIRARVSEIGRAKEKKEQSQEIIRGLDQEIGFLEKHLENLRASAEDFSQYDSLYRQRQTELKNAFSHEKDVEIAIAQLNKELELTRAEIQGLEEKIEQLERTRTRLHNILDLEKWLSGEFLNLISFTERNILITLREAFSKLFNQWFAMLTTDAFFVHLDENFTPVITQGDFELDYAYLSGGERTAVALAYRLALNQIINSLLSQIKTRDIVILDEPTDGFSEAQLDKVRDILHELTVGQLILVSHEQKIEGFVDNIIRLRKETGVSNISE